jgi:hypothetical protein
LRGMLLCVGLAGALLAREPAGQPVLVELFTSVGCSTCAPADWLLEKLQRKKPVATAQIIVLSEHVNYWNDGGWTDPFSSAAFSQRQELYVKRFHLRSPYTPEAIVDGNTELNGSDAAGIEAAIQKAASEAKPAILRAEL